MFISPAFRQTAAGSAASGGFFASPLAQFVPFIFIIIIFYFLLIRPQQQQAREQKEKIGGAQRGDEVLTAGGVYGKVVRVDEETIEVEIAKGVVVKVLKTTLADVRSAASKKPAND